MRSRTIHFTFEDEDAGRSYGVLAIVRRGSPGHRNPTYDCGGCPPDPGEVEILNIEDEGQDVYGELSQGMLDRIQEQAEQEAGR